VPFRLGLTRLRSGLPWKTYGRGRSPAFIQPSFLEAAGALAKRLVELAPDGLNKVTFANSGAEAVEAAFKLCRASTGRQYILSHTQQLPWQDAGSAFCYGNKGYQEGFGAPTKGFYHIPYGDLAALAEFLQEMGQETAAFIVEPIQGEGGHCGASPGLSTRGTGFVCPIRCFNYLR